MSASSSEWESVSQRVECCHCEAISGYAVGGQCPVCESGQIVRIIRRSR